MIISVIRTFLLYIMIILAVRIMGKRQISELQTSELVVTLLISDIAAIPMQNTSQPLVSGLIPIFILIFCEVVLSVIMMSSSKFRGFVCGKPLIVIEDGRIDQKEMKRLRMSTEDLSEQLRQLDVFSLSDVQYAIVETNGKMSVLKKPEKLQPTNEQLNVTPPNTGIEAVVINNGTISDQSLVLCELDRDFIKKILLNENIKQEDVFIMTANRTRQYQIIKKG
ncbi:MAG: DUF421 domain-containing protein [Bacillota bacterium]|nr:DUF421 domain-containing protein [Bacillota bacterium]